MALRSILLHLLALNGLSDEHYESKTSEEPWCPGLARHPVPRKEPWNIKYAAELADRLRHEDAGQGLELIFYGDSITEQWAGTDQGGRCERCDGDPDLFKKYFGQYRADVMAVGGDQVDHLVWRLLHGELPHRHHPRLAVIMIGTNDLGQLSACSDESESVITQGSGDVISRLALMLELFQDRLPDTELLLLGLTPRGDDFRDVQQMNVWPSIFTSSIESINAWLALQAGLRPGVHFLDCGPDLLLHGQITSKIFVDGLHPTHAGMDIMGRCIAKVVDKIMQRPAQALDTVPTY